MSRRTAGWWMVAGLLLATALLADGGDPPWMPPGYRLLTFAETDSLLHSNGGTELGEINRRNTVLLDQALAGMNSATLEALETAMRAYGAQADLAPERRNYAWGVMARVKETLRLLGSRSPTTFAGLLEAQEAGTTGFPDDRETVSSEAERIEQALGKQPREELYLAVLRPLRARPWNRDARRTLHMIVGRDDPDHPSDRAKFLTLRMAALEFARRREAEQPSEGSWVSLEATLLPTPDPPPGAYFSRADVEHARTARFAPQRSLWERAIALKANDDETHSMAIILARLDGDAAREREALAWSIADGYPAGDGIEHNVRLFGDWYLPEGLRERLYKLSLRVPGGATDWEGRLESLQESPNGELVIAQTEAILAQPSLPERYRAEFLSLHLARRLSAPRPGAQGEYCDPIAGRLPELERLAANAYPAATEGNLPPPPHNVSALAGLRGRVAEMKEALAQLPASTGEGAGGGTIAPPSATDQNAIAAFRSDLEHQVADLGRLLAGPSDSAVLAEWNRREYQQWRATHVEKQDEKEVLPFTDAERLTLPVRAAVADCYRDEQRFADATAVVARCLQPRAEVDSPCALALVNVGTTLVSKGTIDQAVAAYRTLQTAQVDPMLLKLLRRRINTAAPGSL